MNYYELKEFKSTYESYEMKPFETSENAGQKAI